MPLRHGGHAARTISTEYAPRLSVIARIAAVYSSMCTPSAGKPKKMKNSWTTNGVLRIASTYAPISGRKRTAARASALYAAAPSTPTRAEHGRDRGQRERDRRAAREHAGVIGEFAELKLVAHGKRMNSGSDNDTRRAGHPGRGNVSGCTAIRHSPAGNGWPSHLRDSSPSEPSCFMRDRIVDLREQARFVLVHADEARRILDHELDLGAARRILRENRRRDDVAGRDQLHLPRQERLDRRVVVLEALDRRVRRELRQRDLLERAARPSCR